MMTKGYKKNPRVNGAAASSGLIHDASMRHVEPGRTRQRARDYTMQLYVHETQSLPHRL